jgi:hypothetical protein
VRSQTLSRSSLVHPPLFTLLALAVAAPRLAHAEVPSRDVATTDAPSSDPSQESSSSPSSAAKGDEGSETETTDAPSPAEGSSAVPPGTPPPGTPPPGDPAGAETASAGTSLGVEGRPAPTNPSPLTLTLVVPTTAMVHAAVDYPDAWLEMRSITDRDEWQRVCQAPCDQELQVDGNQVRVVAPGMVTSNAFRIEPGGGVARIRVAGGSTTARTAGLTLMVAGVPLSFGGMTAFGIGAVDERPALRTGGLVAAIVGGVAILSSLPLLLAGSTNVRNQDGEYIAARPPAPRF